MILLTITELLMVILINAIAISWMSARSSLNKALLLKASFK